MLAFDPEPSPASDQSCPASASSISAQTGLWVPARMTCASAGCSISPIGAIMILAGKGYPVHWMVRRSSFRQHGIPHTLLVLSDVSTRPGSCRPAGSSPGPRCGAAFACRRPAGRRRETSGVDRSGGGQGGASRSGPWPPGRPDRPPGSAGPSRAPASARRLTGRAAADLSLGVVLPGPDLAVGGQGEHVLAAAGDLGDVRQGGTARRRRHDAEGGPVRARAVAELVRRCPCSAVQTVPVASACAPSGPGALRRGGRWRPARCRRSSVPRAAQCTDGPRDHRRVCPQRSLHGQPPPDPAVTASLRSMLRRPVHEIPEPGRIGHGPDPDMLCGSPRRGMPARASVIDAGLVLVGLRRTTASP